MQFCSIPGLLVLLRILLQNALCEAIEELLFLRAELPATSARLATPDSLDSIQHRLRPFLLLLGLLHLLLDILIFLLLTLIFLDDELVKGILELLIAGGLVNTAFVGSGTTILLILGDGFLSGQSPAAER